MADEPTSAEGWLEMSHPTLPGAPPAAVSRTAFARVWAPLGWELYIPLAAGRTPAADTVAAPEPGGPTSTSDAAPRRKTAAAAASKED
ncbi:hypothetical protein [Streptomyces sp. NPDC087437]|uniref:hypothetical protein n=1 Tax=Streptomyces sp. NPDC087437 TaxID=3365789 RepID=UPI0038171FDA